MEHDLILNGKKNGLTEFGEDEGNEDNTIEECNRETIAKYDLTLDLQLCLICLCSVIHCDKIVELAI